MAERHPNFIIIGAAKCATTWSQYCLQRHPDIWMPDPELHFFSRNYDRGLDWYWQQFAGAGNAPLVGEKSNSYLDDPEALERLKQHLPNCHLVVQLRNPVERAYSDYCMLFRRGEVDSDIARHLDPERTPNRRFIESGLYAHHLDKVLAFFPRERLHVIVYETLRAEPEVELQRLATFLGLSDQHPIPVVETKVKDKETPIVHGQLRRCLAPLKPMMQPFRRQSWFKAARSIIARRPDYPALDPEQRQELQRFFRADIDALKTRYDADIDVWLEDSAKAGRSKEPGADPSNRPVAATGHR